MAGIRVDASDLKKVGRIARAFDPALAKQLRKNLTAAGKLGANAAKEGIMAMPSKGTDDHNLRGMIAAAVKVSVTTSGKAADVRIKVTESAALTAYGAPGIPKAINRGRWKHPVYGHMDRWVEQAGVDFFEDRINPKAPEMTALALAALEEAVRIATEAGYL